MSQVTKTALFAAAAVVSVVLALLPGWLGGNAAVRQAGSFDELGQPFFDIADPLAATRLEIVKFDAQAKTLHTFVVAQVDGRWSIPSHFNYPADANTQLSTAATFLAGLKKLGLRSVQDTASGSLNELHRQYGVIAPEAEKLDITAEGVGTLVRLSDKDGKVLAQLIIGNVYEKEITAADLDTPFPVEPDTELRYVRVPGEDRVFITQLRKSDMRSLSTRFGDWIEKNLLDLNEFDVRRVVWNDYSIKKGDGGLQIEPGTVVEVHYDDSKSFNERWTINEELSPYEELDTTKLNDATRALSDLQIVDVQRKPAGLGRDLRADEGIRLDAQAIFDLGARGFYFTGRELLSDKGEVIVEMKDGVTYVLRFGEIAEGTGGADDEDSSANRYLFVAAHFNPERIPKPNLRPLPEPSAPLEAPQPGAATTGNPQPPADAPKPSPTAPDAEYEAKRKEVEEHNRREQEAYDKKVEEARNRVRRLNDRFADWYYVISDKEYKRIHLTRADIVRTKQVQREPGYTIGDFERIKLEGLRAN
jgi:hypothetical protein